MILVLTNADTEILALRTVAEGLPPGFPAVRAANPARLTEAPSLEGVDAVLVRLLGGRRAWEGPFDELVRRCLAGPIPLLAFGGEAAPDQELAAATTVPDDIAARGFEYLVQGGLANIEHLLRFVADTVLGHGYGFEPPVAVPSCGVLGDPDIDPARPTIGVVFYRAHLLSGNTGFVTDLCAAIEARGANALPVYCYSLRPDGDDGTVPAIELLAAHDVAAVVTTVLAAGSARDDGDGWDASALAAMDVPVLQAVAATSSSDAWADSSGGLSPLDVAMAVAVPELDGRVVGPAFSFKETVDDGDDLGAPVTAYRTVADRVDRIAGLATRLASLRRTPVSQRRVGLVLSAYPTKRSRLGNAVGLDTPASVIELLRALAAAGYRVDRVPPDGDALMAELADAVPYASDEPEPVARGDGAGSWSEDEYERHFAQLPAQARADLTEAWGPAPGGVFTDGGHLVFAGLDLGGVLVAVQPPRGFGESAVAVYHSPDLAPTHHYVAFYRWLDAEWGADAIVHVGKHGTLEWLPGKSVGLSAACWPDAALGDLPVVYPFVMNDPGEGTQAKRRAHAVIVDHLVPPLTRADTYDDLARLEALLDTHAQAAALDPGKLPAIRRQVWDLLVQAEIHRDLGMSEPPGGDDGFEDPAFDDAILHVDGYLCELKDAQIRGGLHTLGRPPDGEAELDLVLALTRLDQGAVPSLRTTVAGELGVDLASGRRADVDSVEAECRRRLSALQARRWEPSSAEGDATLRWVGQRLVPALHRTTDEISSVLAALDGRHVPSGPSGAPSRGMAHALPTGRNFYSLDPRAVPSPLAWQVGSLLAERLLEAHVAEEGRYPQSVGLVVWGTAAMRTSGDDIAEALALMGVRPVWAEETGRVTGLEVVPLDELGRPRIDVTVRVSGFFRDAFPHVLGLLDEAVRTVAALDEPASENFVAAHGAGDPRVFGPKPGAYGSGILALLESRDWRSDEDLAAVYLAWGGYSYGRGGAGVDAPDAMRRRFAGIEVAAKNQDNREHDIFDSDDYLQDHGGMVATIRALTGRQPKAWFGDTADPTRPRVRPLSEEAARVVRTRVVNPKWIDAMRRHGYKGAFEMAATVDYLFGYDATAGVAADWMYERVTEAYVGDVEVRKFFEQSNPWALRSIAERLLEANERGLWNASRQALDTLRAGLLEAEGWEEGR
ncbi:MAG: cobaltochelatase subunit CobN [Actinobacteria bacterium]|nr:MAG: cobaltochelatase subunit CobN [Actinomycetota bacterium]